MFHDALAQHTAQGAAAGDVIATFDSVGLLAPRGRFEVEMYLTSMKLLGQVRLDLLQQRPAGLLFVMLPRCGLHADSGPGGIWRGELRLVLYWTRSHVVLS